VQQLRFSMRALRVGVPILVVVIAAEAVLSIVAGWPYQFGGQGDPHKVLSDFASHGTALAPPLFLLVPLVIVALGLQLSRGWRVAAAILLVPLAAIMTVGAAGETLAAATPDVPRAVQIVGGGLDTVLSVAMLITAVAAIVGVVLSRRERSSPAAQPTAESH
jgi:hypothetical protein